MDQWLNMVLFRTALPSPAGAWTSGAPRSDWNPPQTDVTSSLPAGSQAVAAAVGKGAPRKIAQARWAGLLGRRVTLLTRPWTCRFWSKVEHARFLEGIKRFGSQDAHSIAA